MANRENVQKFCDMRTHQQLSMRVFVELADIFYRQLKFRGQPRDDSPLIGLFIFR